MSQGKKLLTVAEELNYMVDSYAARQGITNKEQLLNQALHGVNMSLANVLSQLNLVIKIENGSS